MHDRHYGLFGGLVVAERGVVGGGILGHTPGGVLAPHSVRYLLLVYPVGDASGEGSASRGGVGGAGA